MISENLQQEILAYGQNLHVSQRGLFFKARNYSQWRKRLILFFAKENFSECLNLEDVLSVMYSRKNGKPREDSIGDGSFRAFLVNIFIVIFSPLLLVPAYPFLEDVLRTKLTWDSVPASLLIEAILLGCLVDENK
jgi:hypothetical protein